MIVPVIKRTALFGDFASDNNQNTRTIDLVNYTQPVTFLAMYALVIQGRQHKKQRMRKSNINKVNILLVTQRKIG